MVTYYILYWRKAVAEAQERIDDVWRPYHAKLQALLDAAHDRHGQAVLIDCHSMPHEAMDGVARGGVKRPEIVLADEPTANLDAKNAHAIIQTMKRLNKELNTTFVFSTHDEKVMMYLDRIISLEDGRVVKDEWQESKTVAS